LVLVAVSALVHLGGSARAGVTVGEVETFALVGPGDAFVSSDGELLVGVSGEASVDLHLDVVGGGAVGDIETLVTEDLQAST